MEHVRENSKNPNDETDQSEETDEATAGRSYGCVFCKRGFTTAQALGGHMNIHRKDRAKTKPAPKQSPSSNKHNQEAYTSQALYPWSSAHPSHHFSAHDASLIHGPETSVRSTNAFYGHDLSLRLGSSIMCSSEGKQREAAVDEYTLDLELRLGHDP